MKYGFEITAKRFCLFVGRPIMDDKYDLKKHVNFRYTEDGGASPYDYAKTPLAHDDLKIDINRLDDYELLSTEDILGE